MASKSLTYVVKESSIISLYSSRMWTSATAAALSIISRVTLPLSSAMAQRIPGSRVVVSPKREQTARKSLRSSIDVSPWLLSLAGHYILTSKFVESEQQTPERLSERSDGILTTGFIQG